MDSLFNQSLNELAGVTLTFDMSNTTAAFPFITTTPTVNPHPEVALSLKETRFAVQTILTPLCVIVGLLGNILNILVLLQPNMRSSTNVYILVLSFADSIYLVFNFALSILDCRKRGLSNSAYYFNPYGRFVSNFSGNVAVWVTVGFTVERYIAVCHPMQGKRWCTVSRAKLASAAIVILTLLNTVPTIFELEVEHTDNGPRCSYTTFASSFSYEMVYSWWYVTVFTFIPLICLAIFNIVLIRALLIASRKRQQLVLVSKSNSSASKSEKKKKNNNKMNNSTNGSVVVREKTANTYVRGGKRAKFAVSFSDLDRSSMTDGCLTSVVNSCTQDIGVNNVGNINTSASKGNNNLSIHVPSTGQKTRSNVSPSNSYNSLGSRTNTRDTTVKRQSKRMSREQNKVTLLLVTIVMIFLLCQLPWTALFLYKTYLSNNNLRGNSTHIKMAGNICNLLGLINASVNFYLYSCFSKRFRKTFKSLVLFWRRKSSFFPSMV